MILRSVSDLCLSPSLSVSLFLITKFYFSVSSWCGRVSFNSLYLSPLWLFQRYLQQIRKEQLQNPIEIGLIFAILFCHRWKKVCLRVLKNSLETIRKQLFWRLKFTISNSNLSFHLSEERHSFLLALPAYIYAPPWGLSTLAKELSAAPSVMQSSS